MIIPPPGLVPPVLCVLAQAADFMPIKKFTEEMDGCTFQLMAVDHQLLTGTNTYKLYFTISTYLPVHLQFFTRRRLFHQYLAPKPVQIIYFN